MTTFSRRFWLMILVAIPALAYDTGKLDQFFASAAASIPSGMEVLIVHDGRTLYWKQFGAWPKNRQAKIASSTKWLSGAVIMSLVDDGTLSLDDRASKYLPYLTGEKAGITIRQLMSHTAGFAGEFPPVNRCLGDPATTLDACAQAIAAVPLAQLPGAGFTYAGADMQIAGRVAEVASGKDWQTLFRERIAAPLGMNATDYEYLGPTRDPRISGGGRSTVSDYMRFLVMLANGGTYEGRRILSKHAVDVMLSDQTAGVPIVRSPLPRAGTRYGIGNWVEGTANSSPGVAGWIPLLDRSRGLAVVVGTQRIRNSFLPHYPELKKIFFEMFGEEENKQ